MWTKFNCNNILYNFLFSNIFYIYFIIHRENNKNENNRNSNKGNDYSNKCKIKLPNKYREVNITKGEKAEKKKKDGNIVHR